MKNAMNLHMTAVILVFFLLGASCSTKPKNQGDVYVQRIQAERMLETGNREADRGNYDSAMLLINDSKRLAILVDDPGLRVRTGLSLGNVLFNTGQREDAFAEWDTALAEAEIRGTPELVSVSRIHILRGKLLSGETDARSVLDQVNRGMGAIKDDQLYIAFAWLVIGLSQRELGLSREAEASVRRSLDIHEKEMVFEQAAYDWFLIGSIRSLSGNYDGAIQALQSAIAFDRRVENSWGLASDWRALGDVHKKAGRDAESREAYLRAASIFRALGNDAEARSMETRANGQ
jgi:tetratricopeptide (TPR) repeat protein